MRNAVTYTPRMYYNIGHWNFRREALDSSMPFDRKTFDRLTFLSTNIFVDKHFGRQTFDRLTFGRHIIWPTQQWPSPLIYLNTESTKCLSVKMFSVKRRGTHLTTPLQPRRLVANSWRVLFHTLLPFILPFNGTVIFAKRLLGNKHKFKK